MFSCQSGNDSRIKDKPKKRMANPKIASPYKRIFSLDRNIKGKAKANIGRLNSEIENLPIPNTATIHAVTVVPRFAPIITPTDCSKVIRPALTKLTIITVVAEEDCKIPVTLKPVNTPIPLLAVIILKVLRNFAPATF